MKVRVYPADDGGCGNYRLRWPAQALAASGEDVQLAEGLPGIWRADLVSTLRGMAGLAPGADAVREITGIKPMDADVVVLQRPLQRDLADAVPHLQAQGIAVVVEVDDDFHSVPRANSAWEHVHPTANPARNYLHLGRACAAADLVTVSTPALAARYAKHGRVAVLPNCLPARYLDIPIVDTPNTVGWSGIVDTHPGDLETTRGAVGRLVRDLGLEFRVVGNGLGVRRRLELPDSPTACGWRPIEEYPSWLAQLGVGIVPLALHQFNEAKSWLKGIEYASVGVPFVAAPTSEYRRLAKLGAGEIAARPRDWERLVRRLATNSEYRRERGDQAREVARRWTIEEHAHRWLAAWKTAADNRAVA